MTALATDKIVPFRPNRDFSVPVAAGALIYMGALVVLNDTGYGEPGLVATNVIARGVAQEQQDNSAGNDGDLSVAVRAGCFRFANAGDITAENIMANAYIVDDQTVAVSSGSSTRSIAGAIMDVDSDGVWVAVGEGALPAATSLSPANNLDDVASAASSRANLGVNKHYLSIDVATLVGTGVYRTVSPIAGTITKIWSVIDGALTTGDATLTGKIGATAITSGVITITESGSAAGDVDSATPSAANAVSAGDVVSVTVGGTNDTASVAEVIVEITY